MGNEYAAFSLIEYTGVAHGVLAVDRMLKRSPIALLKCGTIHPGRYLALVGGTVASVEEAWSEGCDTAEVADEVFLPDPHPALRRALTEGSRMERAESLAIIETATSPAVLRAVDAALKAVPVRLVELRLADDLGGRAVAFLTGALTDLQAALEIAPARAGAEGAMVAGALMPRVEEKLLEVIGEGTRFAGCRLHEPEGAEILPAGAGE